MEYYSVDRFIGYKVICGEPVAEYYSPLRGFVLNKESLKVRLSNLKKYNRPDDGTQIALDNFPPEAANANPKD